MNISLPFMASAAIEQFESNTFGASVEILSNFNHQVPAEIRRHSATSFSCRRFGRRVVWRWTTSARTRFEPASSSTRRAGGTPRATRCRRRRRTPRNLKYKLRIVKVVGVIGSDCKWQKGRSKPGRFQNLIMAPQVTRNLEKMADGQEAILWNNVE